MGKHIALIGPGDLMTPRKFAMTIREREVLKFIDRFTNEGARDQVIECFLNGCCYWFAATLARRFGGARIMYDQTIGHFGCEIGGEVYDITGKVTHERGHKWQVWEELAKQEPGVASGILTNCVFF